MDIDSSRIIRLFNHWADSYDADIVASEWGFEHYNDAVEWICHQLVSNLKPDRVIDLGCGTGILAGQLQRIKPSIEYVGIDISPQMIKIARTKSPTTSFIQADIRDYSRWIKYLDLQRCCTVISTYSLHHISDEEKIRLFKYVFSASKRLDFRFIVVDYAFFDICDRKHRLREQGNLGNRHVTEEIGSEYYADLSLLRNALSPCHIDLSFEKNGIWDWRILARHAGG